MANQSIMTIDFLSANSITYEYMGLRFVMVANKGKCDNLNN